MTISQDRHTDARGPHAHRRARSPRTTTTAKAPARRIDVGEYAERGWALELRVPRRASQQEAPAPAPGANAETPNGVRPVAATQRLTLTLWRCPPLAAWLSAHACAAVSGRRPAATVKPTEARHYSIEPPVACHGCRGVVALAESGLAPPPREIAR